MGRKLKASLVNLIEARIPLTEEQIMATAPNVLVLFAMSAFEGVRELTNHNDGAIIDAFNYCTGAPKKSSYCMSAYQCAVRYVENKLGIVSPLFTSPNSQDVFNRSPERCRIELWNASPGDALIYQHGETEHGHTAPVVCAYPDMSHTIEANTSSGPGVNGNGDGVYFRMRSVHTEWDAMHLIGAIRAFPDHA